MAPRETENTAYAKLWGDKQTALWYVMVYFGLVNNRPKNFCLYERDNCDGDGNENVTGNVNTRCFALYYPYPISFNSTNAGNIFLEFNSKRLYRSSGKEKESRCLVFTSFTKRRRLTSYPYSKVASKKCKT